MKPCIICYRLIANCNGEDGSQIQETLEIFFKLLGRLLNPVGPSGNEEISWAILDNLINSEMVICVNCSSIMDSFCELYHQMKTIELLLHWKVKTLAHIMSTAQKKQSRLKAFSDCLSQTNSDIRNGLTERDGGIAELVFDFKRSLIQKCTAMLSNAYPRLSLNRCFKLELRDNIKSIHASDQTGNKKYIPNLDLELKVKSEPEPMTDLSQEEIISHPIHSQKDPLELMSDDDEERQPAHFPDNLSNSEDDEAKTFNLEYEDEDVHDIKDGPDEKHIKKDAKTDAHANIEHPDHRGCKGNTMTSPCDIDIKKETVKSESEGEEGSDFLFDESSLSDWEIYELTSAESEVDEDDPLEPPFITSRPPPAAVPRSTNKPTAKGKHQCSACLKYYSTEKLRKFHYKTVHLKADKVTCIPCGKDFTRRSLFVRHNNIVHKKIRHVCSKCNKSFTRKCHLSVHLQAVDCTAGDGGGGRSKRRNFPCKLCGLGFARYDHMQRHVRNIHSVGDAGKQKSEDKSKADGTNRDPDQTINRQDSVEKPVSSQSEVLEFICDICEEKFRRKDHLARHRRQVHFNRSEAKPTEPRKPESHVCDQCGKVFKTVNGLKHHIKTVHLKLREEHICPHCGKIYAHSSSLGAHVREMHLNIQTHECDLCGRTFNRKRDMDRHRLGVHREKKSN